MKSLSFRNLILLVIVMLWRRVRRRYGRLEIYSKNTPIDRKCQRYSNSMQLLSFITASIVVDYLIINL